MKSTPFWYALRIWLASVAISPIIFTISIFERMPGNLAIDAFLLLLLISASVLFGLPSLPVFSYLVMRKFATGADDDALRHHAARWAPIILALNFGLVWAILRSDVLADAWFYLRLVGAYLLTTMCCIRYMRLAPAISQ
ncbi:hypothetical protein WJU16_07355 [Chitinophaga pollutisoli]|uniref:Uncharacterized protein n=1 Tax=Chitinophaga pollutisoli TaxID=3133966 RepID=A0ABZ2YTG8_9BACT